MKWSETRNGTASSAARDGADGVEVANRSSSTQVSYAYKPTIGYTITGTLTLSEQMYMMPRITAPTLQLAPACT